MIQLKQSTRINVPHLIGLVGNAGAGKDTAAHFLKVFYSYKRFAFADAVKDVVKAAFDIDCHLQSQTMKNLPDLTWGASPRELCQVVGTECFRETFGPEIWVKILAHRINKENYQHIAITDVRFQNEVDWIAEQGGSIVHIKRDGMDGNVGVANHASEQINSIHFPRRTFKLENNGSIMDLRNSIHSLIQSINSFN